MGALLLGWWDQLWPNLVANILWVTPALILHHKLMKRRFADEVALARQEFKEHFGTMLKHGRHEEIR